MEQCDLWNSFWNGFMLTALPGAGFIVGVVVGYFVFLHWLEP